MIGKVLISGIILGLQDGILNPCTLSLIVMLISFLISIRASRRIFKCGLAFSIGVGLVYLIFLFSLLYAFSYVLMGYSSTIAKVLAILLIIFGIIEIKDFFFYGKGISLRIPKKFSKIAQIYVRRGTIISSFTLGCLGSLVEIPCAGIFPFAYIMLIPFDLNMYIKWLLLLWYIFFFIAPLILISFLVQAAIIKLESIEAFYKKGRRYMRLFAGIVMLILSYFFLTGF